MSSIEFLSVNNLKELLSILQDVMRKKYYFTLDINNSDIKNIFLVTMNKINSDPANVNLDVTTKNKLTLKIVREIIKLNKMNNPVHQNALHREQDINSDRSVNYQNTSTSFVGFQSNKDVVDKMEFINNVRDLENSKETPEWSEKPIMENCDSETEFKNQINDLELSRSDFDNKLLDIFPKPKDSSINNENEFLEKRNRDISSILNKPPEDIDPTAFFKKNNAINHSITSQTASNSQSDNFQQVPSTYKNLALATIIEKQPVHEARLEKKYILINSYDRNWLVDKKRYKYKVRFAYSTNEIMKVPYYENNPTVPFTKTEKYNGLPNDFGWVDRNGNFYQPYDSSLPPSSNLDINGKPVELGFEDIEIIVDQDASMIGTFKDIYSLSVTNVSIPTEIFHKYVNANAINSLQVNDVNNYNFNFNFPYILCNIDEFQDVYDGTDDTIRKAFCQLQYDNLIKTPNGRGYIILKPVQNEIKFFHPNPLSSLPTLNLSLTKPNGELINNSEDGLCILSISVYQNYYLKITTKHYFDKDSFYRGDFVRIKNFNLYQINSTISKHNIETFNSFINRKEGHSIYEIGEPNEEGYFNTFHIYGLGNFNPALGKFEIDSSITDTLSEFNNHLNNSNFFESSSVENFENGYLLNMSLQNTISITVEMYKPDSTIVKSETSRLV